uniref:C-type lectin domain-containing protein n=1 Tax=Acrobeloides nanus TaxID=290746 RepID=A0A914EGE6_9BILA
MKFFLLLTGFLTLCGVASECPPTTFSNVNDDKCYYGIATSNGFDDASAFCAVQLGYLASVANAFENAALLADMQLTLGPNGQAWMGGKLGSDWGWTDGEDMSYTNWKP